MYLHLKVEEDEELRSYIKDLIRGQVTSMVREDLQSIVTNALLSETNRKGQSVREYVSGIITEILSGIIGKSEITRKSAVETLVYRLIRQEIEDYISLQIKEFTAVELKAMIQKEVQRYVVSMFGKVDTENPAGRKSK